MHLVRQREMNNNGGGPCGACKFLRRKCVKGCVFAPYFEPDDRGTADFEAVHRVFGAKNVAKLLLRIPAHTRFYAVVSLCYEALSRIKDPVYGCVAQVFNLQQQVDCLQAQLAYVQARLSMLKDRRTLCQSQANLLMLSSAAGSSLTSVDFGVETSCFSSEGNVLFGDQPLFEEVDVDVEIIAQDVLTNYPSGQSTLNPKS